MVEVLRPGAAAEICRMPEASDDLNGVKGVVMRYDEKKGRYTFELDESGEIMSLRANNLRKIEEDDDNNNNNKATESSAEKPKSSDKDKDKDKEDKASEETTDDDEDEPTKTVFYYINDIVTYTRPNGDESIAKVFSIRHIDNQPCYGIKLLETNVEKHVMGDMLNLVKRDETNGLHKQHQREPGIIDQIFFSMYRTVAAMDPTTIAVAVLAIIYFWPSSTPSHSDRSDAEYHDDDYYYHRRHYWGHWGWYHWNWYGFVGGIGSCIFLGVYLRKLGTDNGRRRFNWDRTWQKVMEMDFWQLVRLAGILEMALHFAGNFAGGGGGRRRR